LGVENLSIVFADIKVAIFMLGKKNLLFVVAKFEVCDVVLGLWRCIIDRTFLFLFLAFLFDLFRGLGGFASKVSGTDLAAEDTSLSPVAVLDA